MTRREELEQAAIEINLDPDLMRKCLLDRLVAVGEWADKNPQKGQDHRHFCHCGECVWYSGQQGIKTGNVPDEK